MTPQEQQLIDGLVNRVRSTPANDKDDEADRYLHQNLDAAPDALYVLAQTVIVQQYGLENAQRQIADLQQQLAQAQQQPHKQGSFLGRLLGTDDSAPQQQAQYQPVNTGYAAAPPPPYAQPAYAQPVGYGAGGGGFLRGALQTAAGVAAGEVMFQGVESLFHGFGGGGYGYGGGFGERPVEEVINNDYYDDRDGGEREHGEERGDDRLQDASYDTSQDGSNDDYSDSGPDYSDDGGSDDGGVSGDSF